MSIKTLPQPPYSPDLAPCDFWLFPKLRDCRYVTIEEMKEAVTKVIDTLTQSDFHGAFQKLLERYNKYIAARGDYFEGDKNFMCVLSIKGPIWKKSGNLFNDPHVCDLKVALRNVQNRPIWEFMIYKFELGHNAVEATNILCWTKSEVAVDHNIVIRCLKKFYSCCTNLNDQAYLRMPKNQDHALNHQGKSSK